MSNRFGDGGQAMGRILTWAIGAVFAVVFSQAPEFAQQYQQRIGGAIDELAKIITAFDQDAGEQGLQRAQALARLKENADPLAAARGERMEETIGRFDRLKRQVEALRQAGPVARVFAFARDFDTEIGRAAAEDFEPAVPVTIAGFVAAAIGFLLALFGGGTARAAVRGIRKRRRGRLEPSADVKDA